MQRNNCYICTEQIRCLICGEAPVQCSAVAGVSIFPLHSSLYKQHILQWSAWHCKLMQWIAVFDQKIKFSGYTWLADAWLKTDWQCEIHCTVGEFIQQDIGWWSTLCGTGGAEEVAATTDWPGGGIVQPPLLPLLLLQLPNVQQARINSDPTTAMAKHANTA